MDIWRKKPERQRISLVDRLEVPDLQRRGGKVQVWCRNPNESPTPESEKGTIRRAASPVPGTGDVVEGS
jgi:hypothetical protein